MKGGSLWAVHKGQYALLEFLLKDGRRVWHEQNVADARSDFRSCVDFIPINLVHTVTLGYELVAPNKAIRDGDRKT